METFSDSVCDWLVELGYTHCFFVAGGNIMHLLNSARTRFTCIPVVHEVSAGIAAEYFNELDFHSDSKAFALVTAGPGLTNIITAIAGSFMESRSLLVIGGQVKKSDLSNNSVRQRGIQEIDGVTLAKSICKVVKGISEPISKMEFLELESQVRNDRKGPVFLEICLDAQGREIQMKEKTSEDELRANISRTAPLTPAIEVAQLLAEAKRPLFLIGGGISRRDFARHLGPLCKLGVPLMTTWNGADRVPNDVHINWGRPNTWGMRYSNILLQQSDLIIALGTRLGLQHTGFNWQEFAPLAKVVQVDIDNLELEKGHPKLHLGINADANNFLSILFEQTESLVLDIEPWLNFGDRIKNEIPLSDLKNNSFPGYWNPYEFIELISKQLKENDTVIPSSSGAAETVSMQAAAIPSGVFMVTNKGMASMGYGLAGAIGAAIKTNSRVVHIEGDGGFAQNLQELGTVRVQNLPLKIFIFENGGYASIRMTQKSYFEGQVIGCDTESGLGLPNWVKLFSAYGITCTTLTPTQEFSEEFMNDLDDKEPHAWLVPIHPDQTYFPKITSRILEDGSMVSNPLHLMTPSLSPDEIKRYLPFLFSSIGE
jgi:acetolactate synthase-1/2/3 large subunit